MRSVSWHSSDAPLVVYGGPRVYGFTRLQRDVALLLHNSSSVNKCRIFG